MGSKYVSLYLLDGYSDRESFISSAKGINGLHIHDSECPLAYFKEHQYEKPSIIVCSHGQFNDFSEEMPIISLINFGHHFIIICDNKDKINRVMLKFPESFSFIQPPLGNWKLRPLLLNAYNKIYGDRNQNQDFTDINNENVASMFKRLYDHLSDPIIWVNVDTLAILNDNEAAKTVLGCGLSIQSESILKYSQQPEESNFAIRRRFTYSADRILKNREGKSIVASIHTVYYQASDYLGALIIIKDLTLTTELEIEIAKRDEFFKSVLDSIATPILQVSTDDYRILFVNNITKEKLGYSEKQMVGATIDSFCLDKANIRNLLDGKKSFFAQWKVLNAWDDVRLMDVRAQYIDDKYSRFVINLHDITERQALLENQEYTLRRLREAHRMARVGGWAHHKGDSSSYFSTELLELHGLDPKTSLERSEYLDIIHGDDRGRIEDWINEMISGVKSYPIRYSIKLKDGRTRFFLMHCELDLNDEGEITGLTGTSQDISEVELLEQKNSLYSQIFDTMDAEMILLSEKGIIIEYNQAAAKKLGYSKESLKGKFLSVLNSRYTKESWPRFWKRINDKGGELREARHKRKDGTEYDTLISISLLDYMGEKMALALINDISEIKIYQKELQNNLEEKTALLQEVHHRMGNNLQTIASFISLKSMNTEDEHTRLQLEEVKDRIMGIAAIHNSMYAQGRFLDLDLLEHLQTTWNKHQIKTEFGPDTIINGDRVMIDINRALPLSLVVSELFSNSFRHAFHTPGGRIELNIRNLNDTIQLHYQDNGLGYPESNRKETVGLTLVRNLVERQLKGTIRFYNDHGAHAEILLPKEFFIRSISDPLQNCKELS